MLQRPEKRSGEGMPVLWQLQPSFYNEKVRWALDRKRIPHIRRSLLPGPHRVKARRLTGEIATTPVLTLDGRSIGGSAQIIAAMERRWPHPPLYPERDEERRRALQLEAFFDEELAPHMRRAIYHAMLPYPELTAPMFTRGRRLPARAALRAMYPLLRRAISRTFEIDDASAEESRRRTAAAMDRLEMEIGPSGYLVGDSFTVADLAAAAHFYPVASPPEFPYALVTDPPASARDFLEPLGARRGGEWVTEIYRHHRLPPAG